MLPVIGFSGIAVLPWLFPSPPPLFPPTAPLAPTVVTVFPPLEENEVARRYSGRGLGRDWNGRTFEQWKLSMIDSLSEDFN